MDWRLRLAKTLSWHFDDGVSSGASSGGATDDIVSTIGGGETKATDDLQRIPVAAIAANPYQPRSEMDAEALQGLAQSIRDHGLLQPIIVRRAPAGGYVLVAGHRRLQASRMLGHSEISALVVDAGADEGGLLALVENIQRQDLGFMEEAAAFDRLLRDFGLTQEALAARLGIGQSTVANKLRLLRLPPGVQAKIGSPAFTERHARALLSLDDETAQLAVVDAVVGQGLTVRQTEALVEKTVRDLAGSTEDPGRKSGRNWRGIFRDVRILTNTFQAATDQLRAAGMDVDLQEAQLEEGLEIRVLVRLPAGWRRAAQRRAR